MREIKFRVYHKNERKMYYSVYLCPVDMVVDENDKMIWYIGIDCDVSQYTWLKDNNWKEIYEGDVIRYTSFGLKEYENTIVEVPELTAYHWFDELSQMLDKEQYPTQCDIEVIGNIFEHPQLLKKK